MPDRKSAGDTKPAGNDLLTRVFAAPRSLVFEVWTQAEHFSQWFGPHGAEIVGCELDARPGGVIRFGHRLPDGTTVYSKGTFVEVVRDDRLVFTVGFVDDQGRPVQHPMLADLPIDVAIEMTVTLEDAGDGTRVTLAHRMLPPAIATHPTAKRWLRLAGEGSSQVLDRLGGHLSLATPRKDPRT